jgi:diadenosine tetraphosphate (Ap4A) HIT family hydrolase
MNCVFCSSSAAGGEPVYESRFARVLLHPDSAVRGHAMVVASRHVENLSDLTDEEAAELTRVERAAERALLAASGADRAILMKLGIQTPHLHLHIYPVSADLDRAAVMAIIDGKTREERDAYFVERVRKAMNHE